jgi:hypothetical protein
MLTLSNINLQPYIMEITVTNFTYPLRFTGSNIRKGMTCVRRSSAPSFAWSILSVVCSCWTLREYASINERAMAMAW